MVVCITNALKLYFFPALQALFHQYLIREGKSTLSQLYKSGLILADTTALTTQCISRANHDREAYLMRCLQSILHALHSVALRRLHRNLVQLVHEEVTVFCVHDSLYGGTQHFYAILLQHTFLIQLRTAVQCRLSTESQQNTVRTFFFNDTLHEIRGNRQEIHLVGNAFRCLNRSNVRVHQHRTDTFFTQSLEGLRTRVVELSSLTDLKRT